MLAAFPERSGSSLDLVTLVLSMIAKNGQTVPQQLKTLLVNVISEAKALAQDPKRQGTVRYPESILLALEMRDEADLADSVMHVTNFESIGPEVANRMLSFMGHHSA